MAGFDLGGLAAFVLCPPVLPLAFVAHWICWAHWCCCLVVLGPLVLSFVLFCPLVLPLFLCGPLVLPLFVCCPTGFAACLFVGAPTGFATDFGNIEQRQDLIILAFTLTLYPLRHGWGFLVRLWGCPKRCWCDIGAMMFRYDIFVFWNDSGQRGC